MFDRFALLACAGSALLSWQGCKGKQCTVGTAPNTLDMIIKKKSKGEWYYVPTKLTCGSNVVKLDNVGFYPNMKAPGKKICPSGWDVASLCAEGVTVDAEFFKNWSPVTQPAAVREDDNKADGVDDKREPGEREAGQGFGGAGKKKGDSQPVPESVSYIRENLYAKAHGESKVFNRIEGGKFSDIATFTGRGGMWYLERLHCSSSNQNKVMDLHGRDEIRRCLPKNSKHDIYLLHIEGQIPATLLSNYAIKETEGLSAVTGLEYDSEGKIKPDGIAPNGSATFLHTLCEQLYKSDCAKDRENFPIHGNIEGNAMYINIKEPMQISRFDCVHKKYNRAEFLKLWKYVYDFISDVRRYSTSADQSHIDFDFLHAENAEHALKLQNDIFDTDLIEVSGWFSMKRTFKQDVVSSLRANDVIRFMLSNNNFDLVPNKDSPGTGSRPTDYNNRDPVDGFCSIFAVAERNIWYSKQSLSQIKDKQLLAVKNSEQCEGINTLRPNVQIVYKPNPSPPAAGAPATFNWHVDSVTCGDKGLYGNSVKYGRDGLKNVQQLCKSKTAHDIIEQVLNAAFQTADNDDHCMEVDQRMALQFKSFSSYKLGTFSAIKVCHELYNCQKSIHKGDMDESVRKELVKRGILPAKTLNAGLDMMEGGILPMLQPADAFEKINNIKAEKEKEIKEIQEKVKITGFDVFINNSSYDEQKIEHFFTNYGNVGDIKVSYVQLYSKSIFLVFGSSKDDKKKILLSPFVFDRDTRVYVNLLGEPEFHSFTGTFDDTKRMEAFKEIWNSLGEKATKVSEIEVLVPRIEATVNLFKWTMETSHKVSDQVHQRLRELLEQNSLPVYLELAGQKGDNNAQVVSSHFLDHHVRVYKALSDVLVKGKNLTGAALDAALQEVYDIFKEFLVDTNRYLALAKAKKHQECSSLTLNFQKWFSWFFDYKHDEHRQVYFNQLFKNFFEIEQQLFNTKSSSRWVNYFERVLKHLDLLLVGDDAANREANQEKVIARFVKFTEFYLNHKDDEKALDDLVKGYEELQHWLDNDLSQYKVGILSFLFDMYMDNIVSIGALNEWVSSSKAVFANMRKTFGDQPENREKALGLFKYYTEKFAELNNQNSRKWLTHGFVEWFRWVAEYPAHRDYLSEHTKFIDRLLESKDYIGQYVEHHKDVFKHLVKNNETTAHAEFDSFHTAYVAAADASARQGVVYRVLPKKK